MNPKNYTGNDDDARAEYLKDAVATAKHLGVSVADVIAADMVLLRARELKLEAQRVNREVSGLR